MMANWWDAAPLAEAPKQAPAANANWWDAAPLAQEAKPAEQQYNVTPGDANNPTRIMPKATRDVSMAEAVGRGAAKGVTFNFNDELRGLVEAGGANPNDPASVYNLISGAIKYWSGDKDAERRYNEAATRERAADKTAEEQRPYSTLAGNVAGALAVPVGAMASAATLPARIGRGAAVGAGTGAAYGAGEGDGATDRALRAASGGAVGAGFGGAAAPVLSGVEVAGRGIAALARPVTTAMRGAINPDAEAARRVGVALTRDIRDGNAQLTGAEFGAARAAGAPVANLEMGGETTRALARSSANTSPEGRAALQNLADDRFEGQADRATNFVRGLVGNVDNQGTRDSLRSQAQAVNRPAYQRAYADRNAQSMWDEGFEQLMQAPIVQEAARNATRTGANRAAAEGYTPVRNPFNFEGDRFTLAGNARPSLQFWDQVKRNLDDQIGALQRAGERSAAADAQQLRAALVNHLDQLVPSYQNARAGAARFFGAEDALTAGENFVRSNMTAAEGARAIARMSPQERDLFRQGFASRLIDDINGTRDRVNVLNKIGQSNEARAKLQIALGPQGYQRVEAFLTVEQAMDRLRGALGNSTTTRQLVELGLAGGAGGAITGDFSPQSILTSALLYGGAKKAGQRIDERVARRVADMLASNDPNVLARGVRAAAGNQNIVRAFRDLDRRLSRVGGEQSTGVPALQAAGVGRAEEQQPSVPRPPGQ